MEENLPKLDGGTPIDALTEACLRAAFDVLPEAALIVDRVGSVQYANALAHRLLGDELVIGQAAAWSQPEPERSDTEDTVRTSFVARATGLSLRRTYAPLPDVDGLSLIVLSAVSTAETTGPGRDPAERLNELEATAQVGSWSWDIEADVVSWSDELYRIYGLAPQSMPISYGSFLELVHPDDRAQLEEAVERCYAEGEPYVENHRVVLPDGRLRWHQGRGQVGMSDGRPVRMFGTGQDITDRVLGEQALRQSLEEARRLAAENAGLRAELEVQLEEVRASRARIVQAAYEARRRLERDLHDGAQQRLTMVEMTLRAAMRHLGSSADPELSRTLEQAVEELSAGAAELRSLARGLHPALLTERGLMPALEALATRSQVPVRLRHATIGRLEPSVESAAYFVVSEALTNVMKHAQASRVDLTVERDGSTLVLEVSDDGSGGAAIDAGGGLRGLSDRVAALDGRLRVESPSGRGTLVRVELPCGR
jgi:PAS domain S-box-containing protein